MNIKNISVAILTLSLAGAALAADANPGADSGQANSVTGKTRAEVIAELQKARANGEIISGDDYPGFPDAALAPASHKTRAQVIEELKEARARGEVEVDDYAPAAAPVGTPSGVTRAQVIAELKQSRLMPSDRLYQR